ncbi:potassium-transporting ATPase C chain [Richelia sinica FACHB-800]|uniref:Potassium-transporting ATPase KdpC subunit n=1 Tax=Richelia sinica FACHB-800 TaxID=1357546 RepID=A0A975T3Y4_9NOST|nr:K(+)-transporting ATPase subunit C [Richelia sinica]MBD2665844.1 K(+)-transporting ATPase subunit C [Richelia sinica FACHB-800]QXE21609.1 potassium-transporting ATPase C chain [Richelia sinica FACHB-800]
MRIIREILRALRMTLILWLITAIIYPIFILGVGQAALSFPANGSVVYNVDNQPIGSALIGQSFTSDKYFHSRPSAVKYSQGRKARPTGISGGSNLAPTSPELMNRIMETATQMQDDGLQLVPDLIYASGSGLDPHISLKAARQQLSKVAQARGIKEDEIIPLINKYTEGRFLWIFGEPGVNILRLNYALDLQEINQEQN